jgi:hypothetical protein
MFRIALMLASGDEELLKFMYYLRGLRTTVLSCMCLVPAVLAVVSSRLPSRWVLLHQKLTP